MTTNLGWFVFLLVGCLAWAWQRHQHPASHPAAVTARVQRLLKPRTPDDCPACRQQVAASAATAPVCASVTPWREQKSRRGAPKRIDTQGFACPNQRCAYYRITDAKSMRWLATERTGGASGSRRCAARPVTPRLARAVILRSIT